MHGLLSAPYRSLSLLPRFFSQDFVTCVALFLLPFLFLLFYFCRNSHVVIYALLPLLRLATGGPVWTLSHPSLCVAILSICGTGIGFVRLPLLTSYIYDFSPLKPAFFFVLWRFLPSLHLSLTVLVGCTWHLLPSDFVWGQLKASFTGPSFLVRWSECQYQVPFDGGLHPGFLLRSVWARFSLGSCHNQPLCPTWLVPSLECASGSWTGWRWRSIASSTFSLFVSYGVRISVSLDHLQPRTLGNCPSPRALLEQYTH